ncbi:GPW/gp25 family protein [Bartonella sp. A05]|uniref:GPW/gp25 family protein n=1 Tax=Bartonella sp. A05 TaxID=2967261 RepID=UPI0022A93D64|nr:GPW/gp25 family protein [Bartonella sp. A05]MCZ2203995.1 GPW/gp25 family protein [Bartonella sp. A05]
MNKTTGKALMDVDHLRQSILDILSTRIGTRVMRRDYGSNVPNLIDVPINNTFSVSLYAAVAEALDKWEPRFKLEKIDVQLVETGKISLFLEGVFLPHGKPIKLEGLLVG